MSAMNNQCDDCMYNEYDQEDESYSCGLSLDEDEMYHFLTRRSKGCPYYRSGDEYAVVRHQM